MLNTNELSKVKYFSLLLLIFLVLVGCSSNNTSSDNNKSKEGLDKIEISVTHHPTGAYSVPYEVGIEKGVFEENGIEITKIAGSGGGGTTVRNVLSGDLPFGDVATAATIQSFLAGAPLKVIGGAVQSPADLVYVTRDDGGINDIHDVVGKTWSFTSPGSVTESVTQLMFDETDIDPESLDLVAAGGISEGLTMLGAGEVDSAIMLEPTYSIEKDKWKMLFRVSDYIEYYQQTVLITSPQLIEENPDLVKRFLNAYQESVELVYEDPEEAGRIFAKSAEIDEEASIIAVKDLVEAEHWNTEISLESMKSIVKGMELTGLIDDDEEIEWESIFDLSFLPEDKQLDINEIQ